MTITICIVAFRNADEIAACLGALAKSTYTDFDVVVTENGGEAAYADLLRTVPQVLAGGQKVECLLAPGNLGYAGGVNHCILARPDSAGWWVVNPDTQPEPQALSALMERLSKGDVHAVGSMLYHPDGKVQAYGGWWRPALGRPISIGQGSKVSDPVDAAAIEARMNYILGASLLVDRVFVDQVGLMRDDYFLYCEEVEWCLRAVAQGFKLGFAPASRVQHGQGGTTGSADPIHKRPKLPIYMDERNKIHTVRDTGGWRLLTAAPATLALLTMRYAPRRAWKQWGYAAAGWWAGIRGIRGVPAWLTAKR
jgi:N-acetylglucosaminyl-diphospho-decaprenol L-rhamnosyltransferase